MNTVLETNLEIVLETAYKLDKFPKNKKFYFLFFFFTFFNTDLETNLEIVLETALKLVFFQ